MIFRLNKGTSLLMILLGFATLGLSEPPGAADKGKSDQKKKEAGSGFTIKVPVDVVVVNALVTDKKGEPVKDLTVNDFKIYEDGKPQPIHTFTLETYRSTQDSPPPTVPLKEGQGPPTSAEPAATPRFFSLVIDDLNSPSVDQFYRSIEAMKKFVANQLVPGDLVMISAVSGRAELPFTTDKEAIQRYLAELYKKLNLVRTHKSDCPKLTDLQAYKIIMDQSDPDAMQVASVEFCSCQDCTRLTPADIEQLVRAAARPQFYEDLHFRQVALSSLRTHVRALRHFEGRKSVIFFSPGFISEEVRFELQEVVDRALRSGVIFNTIDTRGLYTVGYDASEHVNVTLNPIVQGKTSFMLQATASAKSDSLFQLAADTGGFFYHNSNDLYAGLKAIAERQTFFYVISYASPNNKNDGRYHKIKLEVSRPGVEMTYRKGYYAPKEEISFESRKKEDILEALRAPGDLNKIPIQVSFNYYQIDDGHFQLSVMTRVDVRDIKFIGEDARHRNVIHLVLVTLDEKDRYVDGLEKTLEFNLTDPGFANLLNYGLTSKVEMAVPPGRYKIKAVVREGAQTKMGSATKWVEVP
jgi:VWFA-related protein